VKKMDDLISRQAAIKATWQDTGYTDPFNVMTAIRDRIEQLPSAHGTYLASLGTDCISRQAAITQLSHNKNKGDDEWELAVENDIQTVWQLPPIQPKRGKWNYSDGKPARIGLSFGVICDQCGTESEYCTNFCGECGADMREVTE
jgi:hypothetical protein